MDTLVGVFDNVNGTVAGLVLVKWNDDCSGNIKTSCVKTRVAAGVNYAIEVVGTMVCRSICRSLRSHVCVCVCFSACDWYPSAGFGGATGGLKLTAAFTQY